jgi:hypothetical protein
MAVPHYTYLVLKMSGPKGIITVKGSFENLDLCDKEFHKMAQNFGMIANYAKKMKSTTTKGVKLLKGHTAEPEMKKPRVVGMTYGAHHGPGNMPAGVPGIPAASAREDRLHSKGRLRHRPAGDPAEEGWSRAMETKLLNGCLAKSETAPTRPSGAQSRSDECHDRVQPMRD